MKKMMFFLMMVMIMISQVVFGQNQKPDNKGAWFIFEDQNYEITISDLVEISQGVENMVAWKSYHLSNGKNFIPVNPELWYEVMIELVTEIDGVKPANLGDSISEHGTIVSWDDNISGAVINYGLNREGKQFIASANFKGDEGFRGLNYKGYLVAKTSKPCINPLRPKIASSVPLRSYTSPKPIFVESSKVNHSFDEVNVNHKMDTLVVLHIMQEQFKEVEPQKALIPTTVPKEKTWFRKNLPWIIPVGAAIIAGSAYLLTKKGKTISPIIEERTMPPGLPATPAPTGGGLSSDPRGMPGGTGGG